MENIKTEYGIHMLYNGVWIASVRRDYNEQDVRTFQSDQHQLGWFCKKCNIELHKSCYCAGTEDLVLTR